MRNTTLLDPKLLAFWIKCLRETTHLSQDALAEASGLDIRTIQRVEAGGKASVTTRRALARGLGYENLDIFDSPDFVAQVHTLLRDFGQINQEDLEKQYPDMMRLPVKRVPGGDELIRLAGVADGILADVADDLPSEAKQVAASIFDYVRDAGDVMEDVSFGERQNYADELGPLLKELENLGGVLFSGIRSTKLTNSSWPNPAPIPVSIVCMTAVPAERQLAEIMIPRRVSL